MSDKTYTVHEIAKLVVATEMRRESSLVQRPLSRRFRYTMTYAEAAHAELEFRKIRDLDLQRLVTWLALSGEGVDVCRGIANPVIPAEGGSGGVIAGMTYVVGPVVVGNHANYGGSGGAANPTLCGQLKGPLADLLKPDDTE